MWTFEFPIPITKAWVSKEKKGVEASYLKAKATVSIFRIKPIASLL